MTAIKPKNCKFCRNLFTPTKTTQSVCSTNCAFQLAKINGLKKLEAETKAKRKEMKDKLKTKGYYEEALQKQINLIVRLIDLDCACISCGTYFGQFQAGHFRAVGGWVNLRYHLTNIFRQCSRCNDPKRKGGNVLKYRESLVSNFGEDIMKFIDDLNAIYPIIKLSIPEIQELIAKTKVIEKELLELNKTEDLPRNYERRIELRKELNKQIGIYI